MYIYQRRLCILYGNGFGELQQDQLSLGQQQAVTSCYLLDHLIGHFACGL